MRAETGDDAQLPRAPRGGDRARRKARRDGCRAGEPRRARAPGRARLPARPARARRRSARRPRRSTPPTSATSSSSTSTISSPSCCSSRPATCRRRARRPAARCERSRSVRRGAVPVFLDDGQELAAAAPFEPAEPDDVALLLHTSGTTSRPKQVPLRQRNLVASARTIAAFYELGPDDVSYCAMPLFHVHGLVASTFGALAGGGTVVVPRRFSPRAFWPQLRRYGVTWFSAGPTLHQMILERIDADGRPDDAPVRALVLLGALPGADGAGRGGASACRCVEAYGMTEASHQMASNPLPPRRAQAGLGRRADRRRDPDRRPGRGGRCARRGRRGRDPRAGRHRRLPREPGGERGVVLRRLVPDRRPRVARRRRLPPPRGPAQGDDPPRRREHLALRDRGGAARPSRRRRRGLLRGRRREVRRGRRCRRRARASPSRRGELLGYCRERLAAFKVPEVVHILDAIPRTPTGKVQRKRVGAALLGADG